MSIYPTLSIECFKAIDIYHALDKAIVNQLILEQKGIRGPHDYVEKQTYMVPSCLSFSSSPFTLFTCKQKRKRRTMEERHHTLLA